MVNKSLYNSFFNKNGDIMKKQVQVKDIRKKLEKLNNISRKRWLSGFSLFDDVWNGHYQREERLLQKELDKIKKDFPSEFSKAINECDCQKYYCTRNHHSNRVGLDSEITPQGGGIIAQSDSFEETEKIALEVYGINSYFIY